MPASASNPAKEIVLFQGMGNNERGWARLVSSFGRVVLIQQGILQHVEVWENGQATYQGPEVSVMSTRKLDEMTFSMLTLGRCLARWREFSRGRSDVIIAANYSMGLAALLLRALGRTRRVAVFLSDYLPPRGSLAVRMHRRLTTVLTRFVARSADQVWSVSPRIPTAAANPRHFVVPICLEEIPKVTGPRAAVGYIGFPTPDHALDVLFDVCKKHGLGLHLIGDSPYLQSIKSQAPPRTVFHGLLNDQARITEILSQCFCGYAVYRNTGPQGYSYYGIPSKTFYCFAAHTPVVTTNTAHFTQNIEKYGVGRVIEPDPLEIEKAILQLRDQYETFSAAIERFRQEWNRHAMQFHRDRFAELWGEPAKDR